jgi:phosphatidylcholine synthase
MSAPIRMPTGSQRARGHAVHLYTASGIVLALLMAMEIASAEPRPAYVFALFAVATLVDATDGPLARRWPVHAWAPRIDGRTIDDIVDYLTFTFLPLLLVWRMGWLPQPAALWVAPALVASLFGFANTGAKQEDAGFFLGFPSYWNVVAFYAGLLFALAGPWPNVAMLLGLAALTVMPVRFIYPNRAPRPWRAVVIIGAVLWLGVLIAMLPRYPHVPAWLSLASLTYPALYAALSWHLARSRR